MHMNKYVVMVLILLISNLSNAQDWIYYDIKYPKNQFLLNDNPQYSAWYHSVGNVEFCKKASGFYCFNADNFKFAVPKKLNGHMESWVFDNIKYSISGISNRSILGEKYLAYSIDSDFEVHKLRFIYTKEAGLIAITTIGEKQGMFLLLAGRCGYAASAACYRQK